MEKMITVSIPEDLISQEEKEGNKYSSRLQGLPSSVKEYKLEDLLVLKYKINSEIEATHKKIRNKKQRVTLLDLEQLNLMMETLMYNETVIKEAISLANGVVNSTIVKKSTLKNMISSNKEAIKGLSNLEKASNKFKELEEFIEECKVAVQNCERQLSKHNLSTKVKITLFELP